MRVPLSWLREQLDIPGDQTGRDVAARLIAVGLEVETVDTFGGPVTGPLVVGQVRSIEELSEFKKPIRYCRVEVGSGNGELIQGVASDERGIVCGASNFSVDDLVVVALPGAVLPGEFAISTRQTYGHTSDGMLASERELGLSQEHAGIIVLPAESNLPGDSAYPVLGIGEEILDIAVTPDRGYALSLRGVARELAGAYGLPFDDPALADSEAMLSVPDGEAHACAIEDTQAADSFYLRTISGLDPTATSPAWLRRTLTACGMRPVSLLVDITNYVMLELGQPLHAFDADRVSGRLRVRRALVTETLETIDHTTRRLHPEDIVVADDRGPLAVAGIMGGLDSEITSSTTRVLIEAVHFDAVAIARSARRHRISSEASRRFERGVDPNLPAIASARATALLVELAGGRYIGVTKHDRVPTTSAIEMDALLPGRLAGMPLPAQVTCERLESIGAQVQLEGETLRATPPSWRPDLRDPHDLVEEVLRLEGFAKIPATLPAARAGFGLTLGQRQRRRARRALASNGLVEVLSYPFLGSTELSALGIAEGDARHALVRLANPISDEAPYLRTTLLPGLLAAVRRNLSRGASEIGLYEIGSVFLATRSEQVAPRPSVLHKPSEQELERLSMLLPDQPRHAAGVLAGERERSGWHGAGRVSTWADALDVVLSTAADLGLELTVTPADLAPWHPGRCAQVSVADHVLGHAGELHPRVIEATGMPARTVAFEFDLDALVACAPPVASAPTFSVMPVAKADLALVVGAEVAAEDVRQALLSGGGQLLETVRLFDQYQGDQVGEGLRSLAFALRMRAPDRTLSAPEVAEVRRSALRAAAEKCGAIQRS